MIYVRNEHFCHLLEGGFQAGIYCKIYLPMLNISAFLIWQSMVGCHIRLRSKGLEPQYSRSTYFLRFRLDHFINLKFVLNLPISINLQKSYLNTITINDAAQKV